MTHLTLDVGTTFEMTFEPAPETADEMTAARLAAASEPARRVAEVASFLGRHFALEHVATMLEVAPSTLLGPLEELLTLGVFVDDGDLGFPDETTRAAVAGRVPRSAQPAIRRQAVDVLVDAGASPAAAAVELAATAVVGDDAAISTLTAAAGAVAATDPGVAADLAGRACELMTDGDARRTPLVIATVDLLHAAGRAERAEAVAHTALRGWLDPGDEAALQMSIARMSDARPAARLLASRSALALSGIDPATRAGHQAQLINILIDNGELDAARDALVLKQDPITEHGDELAELDLRVANARLAYVDGALDLAQHHIGARARGHLEPVAPGADADVWRAEVLVARDQLDAARDAADAAVADTRARGQVARRRVWRGFQGRALLQSGRLTDAAAALDGVLLADGAPRVITASDAAAMVALGRTAIHAGDLRTAKGAAALAHDALDSETVDVRISAAWLLATTAFAAGDALGARGHLLQLIDAGEPVLPRLPFDVTDPVLLMRIAGATGDDRLARNAVALTDRRRELNPDVGSIGAVEAQVRGLLTADRDVLADAADRFADGPRPLASASAHEDHAVAILRDGDTGVGVEVLGAALELYAGCGAAWDAARVRRRLRRLGIRRRLVTPARPTSGWEGLTDAELAVVRLVAAGLKNREVAEQLFISPHTVSMHLRHSFTKLDINSRVELTHFVFNHETAA